MNRPTPAQRLKRRLSIIAAELTQARQMQDWERVRELTDEREALQLESDKPAQALPVAKARG